MARSKQTARKAIGNLHPRHPLRRVPVTLPPSTPRRRWNQFIEKVFSLHPIWKTLGRYLSVGDLKDCRLVSKGFNRMVLDSTDFKIRSCVNLRPDLLSPGEFGTTTEEWKCLKISVHQVCNDPKCHSAVLHDSDWLYHLLKDAQEIILVMGTPCGSEFSPRLRPVPSRILENTPKLRSLSVDVKLLERDIFSDCCYELTKLIEFKLFIADGVTIRKELKGLISFVTASGQLRMLESPPRLDFASDECQQWTMNQILKIAEGTQAIMSSFKFFCPSLWAPLPDKSFSAMRYKVFPSLRCVRLSITWSNEEEIIQFVRNQLPLEEIEIDIWPSKYDGPLPKDLLLAISERSRKLKVLRISACNFDNVELDDWKFLSETNLQELSLWPLNAETKLHNAAQNCTGDFMTRLFQVLPGTLKKLRMQPANGFHYSQKPISVLELQGLDPELLAHLSIGRMPGSFKNYNLLFIFKTLTRLTELYLFKLGSSVTNEAFQGPMTSEYSHFQRLQGLRALTLKECGDINDQLLLDDGMRFKQLRFLDLSGNPKVTRDGCKEMASRNYSLEVFVSDHDLESSMETTNRLRKFKRSCSGLVP